MAESYVLYMMSSVICYLGNSNSESYKPSWYCRCLFNIRRLSENNRCYIFFSNIWIGKNLSSNVSLSFRALFIFSCSVFLACVAITQTRRRRTIDWREAPYFPLFLSLSFSIEWEISETNIDCS